MKKAILVINTLLLAVLASASVNAQGTDKKEEKTTTVDAWRQALPQSEEPSETPPAVVLAESPDNVETRETAAQIEKRILDLEQRLMAALKGRDSVALKHLLADDFMPIGVNIAGAQPDKARYIEWAQKSSEPKSYVVEKTTVRVYPASLAVVTVHYKRQAGAAASPADSDFIATNVWVRRGKQWQAVSHHVSQLAKP